MEDHGCFFDVNKDKLIGARSRAYFELIWKCSQYAEKKGLTKNHRFILNPVEYSFGDGSIIVYRDADVGMRWGEEPATRRLGGAPVASVEIEVKL